MDDFRAQLNEIENISRNIDLTAEDANRTTVEGRTSIEEAEMVLDQIHEQLTVSYSIFATLKRSLQISITF